MWGDFQSGGPQGNPTGGHDTYVFDQHNGNDVINDFQPGIDTIELDGFLKSHIPPQAAEHLPPQAQAHGVLESFTDLNITEANGNSVIHFDANDSVTVVGVTGLTAADFHFVV